MLFFLRLTLSNYNKLSSQSWFSLHRVEIIFNNSVQAAFNATGIYALSSYSYRCQRVSSLRRNDALLLLSSSEEVTSLWEVTFVDFQVINENIRWTRMHTWYQRSSVFVEVGQNKMFKEGPPCL